MSNPDPKKIFKGIADLRARGGVHTDTDEQYPAIYNITYMMQTGPKHAWSCNLVTVQIGTTNVTYFSPNPAFLKNRSNNEVRGDLAYWLGKLCLSTSKSEGQQTLRSAGIYGNKITNSYPNDLNQIIWCHHNNRRKIMGAITVDFNNGLSACHARA